MPRPRFGISGLVKPFRHSPATNPTSTPSSESSLFAQLRIPLISGSSPTVMPLRPGPTMLPASCSTFELIENSIPTLTTISSAESPRSHSPLLAESCLPDTTTTTVMSGIHSRENELVYCQGMIIVSVVWESVAMVSPSVPDHGTVFSRYVNHFSEIEVKLTGRSGRRPTL